MKNIRGRTYIIIIFVTTILMFSGSYQFFYNKLLADGEHIQSDFNDQIKPASDFMNIMGIYCNNYFEYCMDNDDFPLYSYLDNNYNMQIFSMDAVKGTAYESSTGNISGTGIVPSHGIVRSELNMILSCSQYFKEIHTRLPDLAWITYTSEHDFVFFYPFSSSFDYRYSDKLKTLPSYNFVIPGNNIERHSKWTPVFHDYGGKGLIVSLSQPIYYGNVFMGVLSLDLTTTKLSELLGSDYESYLFDQTGSVIAANKMTKYKFQKTTLNSLMNINEEQTEQIRSAPSHKITQIGSRYVYKFDFESAPWTLIVTTSVFSIFFKAALVTLPVIFICILLLITLKEVESRKKAEETIRKIAITDPLTGLKNRYFLESIIDFEFGNSTRYNQPISIILFDLDHFKHVNDTWGHPVGDDVLKHTSQLTQKLLRNSDILFRLGGEEFLILLPNTNIDGAYETAEKLRKYFEENPHPIAGECTASFGIAEREAVEPYISLYKRVDKALYYAKESGRNKVVSYSSNTTLPAASVRLEWNNEWNSGNSEIDEQHRGLLDHANALIYMSFRNSEHSIIIEQIDLLLKHVLDHFRYEENLQNELNFPDRESHAKIHEVLYERAIGIKKAYLNEELRLSAFFSFMLDDVITGHLSVEDVKFFPYIKATSDFDFSEYSDNPNNSNNFDNSDISDSSSNLNKSGRSNGTDQS